MIVPLAQCTPFSLSVSGVAASNAGAPPVGIDPNVSKMGRAVLRVLVVNSQFLAVLAFTEGGVVAPSFLFTNAPGLAIAMSLIFVLLVVLSCVLTHMFAVRILPGAVQFKRAFFAALTPSAPTRSAPGVIPILVAGIYREVVKRLRFVALFARFHMRSIQDVVIHYSIQTR